MEHGSYSAVFMISDSEYVPYVLVRTVAFWVLVGTDRGKDYHTGAWIGH